MLDNGNVALIGFCGNCKLDEKDFKEASITIGENIVSYWGGQKEIDKKCGEQTGHHVCSKCGKTIKDSYIVTYGKITHEVCENKKVNFKQGKPAGGKVARKNLVKRGKITPPKEKTSV